MLENDYLAIRQFPLIRIFTIKKGRCSCGDKGCESDKGKHPADTAWRTKAAPNRPIHIFEGYNVGVVCGNGLVVVDIDERNGGMATLADLPELPRTVCARTGNGIHYYFKGTTASHKLQGIDIQSTGKYVVAPPSLHKSGAVYEWIISPLECDLAPLPECFVKRFELAIAEKSSSDLETFSERDLSDALEWIDSDDREVWIAVGMALHGANKHFEQWHQWSQKSAKYKDESDCSKIWQSFKKTGKGLGSIFYLARQNGWVPELPNEELLYCPEEYVEHKVEEKTLVEMDFPPGITGELTRFILSSTIYSNKSWAIATSLFIVSACVQHAFLSPTDGALSQYLLLVAPAASGKDFYQWMATKWLDSIMPERRATLPSSAQALQMELFECNSRALVVDEWLFELNNIVSSKNDFKSGIIRSLLTLWSCPDRLQGMRTKDNKGSTPDVPHACYSFLGTGTTKQLHDLLTRKEFTQHGLISRCIILFGENRFCPPAIKPKHDIVLPQGVIEKLKALSKLGACPTAFSEDGAKQFRLDLVDRIRWTNEAETLWNARRLAWHHEALQHDDDSASPQSILFRAAEQALRAASLIAALEPDRTITAAHVRWAIRWVEHQVAAITPVLCAEGHETLQERLKAKVLTYLSAHKQATKSHIAQFPLQKVSKLDRANILAALLEENKIVNTGGIFSLR